MYAGKNKLDLTKDTVYKHPTTKQCNYSIDTSNFVTKNDLSYSPRSIGCVKRTIDGAIDWAYSDFDGISVSFSGTTEGETKTFTYNIDKPYPIYFISVVAMDHSETNTNRGGGLTWAIYCNGVNFYTYNSTLTFGDNMCSLGQVAVPNPGTHVTISVVVTFTINKYYIDPPFDSSARQIFNTTRIKYNTF